MTVQIENVVIVGRSWGEKNLVTVESTQNGATSSFEYEGAEQFEIGSEGTIEFVNNKLISFIPAMDEVMA